MSKKVLFIANSPFTILNFRKELILDLASSNYSISVACPLKCTLLDPDYTIRQFRELNIKFIPINLERAGKNLFIEIKLIASIFRIIMSLKPNLIFNYTIKPNIYGSIAAFGFRKARVMSNVTGLGHIFTSKTIFNSIISIPLFLLYKIAFIRNDHVFFQNEDDQALFLEKKILPVHKCVLLNGSGVNTSHFVRGRPPNDYYSFIFIGRLLKEKGIYEYLDAATMTKKKFPFSKFAILGQFDDNPSSLQQVDLEKYLKLGTIEYLGKSNNVKEVLENYSIFVLPSYREGTPRSALEAMSMSMPVITTDVPGCREVVDDNENGYLVPPMDSHSLSQAFDKILQNKELITKFGAKSRLIACHKFDVNKINKKILALIS